MAHGVDLVFPCGDPFHCSQFPLYGLQYLYLSTIHSSLLVQPLSFDISEVMILVSVF